MSTCTSAEPPSQEEGASSDAMAKIRLSLLVALQETEKIEEALQGICPSTSVTDRLLLLVKHLSLIEENANLLDPDHASVPSHILLSLSSQTSESVEILANVKNEMDQLLKSNELTGTTDTSEVNEGF